MSKSLNMQAQTLDTYWRLKGGLAKYGRPTQYKKILEDAGYNLANHNAANTLSEWLHRIDVGLLCYHKCSTDELRKFVKDRRLHKRPQQLQRVGLYNKLMSADCRLAFHRFKDLPPELRNYIYDMYMAEFPTLTTPSQPPITRVSKQIRQESLSIFYACCSFRIQLHYTSSYRYHMQFVFPPETKAFLDALSPVSVSRLSDITIDVTYTKEKKSLGVVRVLKDKNIPEDKNDEYNMTWTPDGAHYRDQEFKLDAMFAEEKKLNAGEKLKIKDIWALRLKMEKAFLTYLDHL